MRMRTATTRLRSNPSGRPPIDGLTVAETGTYIKENAKLTSVPRNDIFHIIVTESGLKEES
jgi:hypothetical protein